MPASLKWLALLLAASVLAAMAAGAVMYAETRARTRVMAEQVSGWTVTAGRAAIARYGCGSCHAIPGVAGASGSVGPSLAKVAVRASIAGRLPNDAEAMALWLRHPQAVTPRNGMPEQGVTRSDARDITAYLYTLK
ncbi:cytochrome c family protein [Sphingomonas sp. BK069]|uniref:c-type cytochrome n=1 Tax=Sphingomonas sp. BK069 TaxID=2586979 RepID=UPI00161D5838|nr:c-type cytochrome [Sphingomonas sp. BK069]MBB3345675.1 cytochrome c2 [Sphingomonas sp. BK069]